MSGLRALLRQAENKLPILLRQPGVQVNSPWRHLKGQYLAQIEPGGSAAFTSSSGEENRQKLGPKEINAAPPKQFELIAAFTCNKCGTRTARGFSKVAYERGVVLVRCGGCQVQHVLSDRLGWFGEAGSVEDFLREKGEAVRKHTGNDGTMEISESDLTGWSKK